jgi:hypothetical protein
VAAALKQKWAFARADSTVSGEDDPQPEVVVVGAAHGRVEAVDLLKDAAARADRAHHEVHAYQSLEHCFRARARAGVRATFQLGAPQESTRRVVEAPGVAVGEACARLAVERRAGLGEVVGHPEVVVIEKRYVLAPRRRNSRVARRCCPLVFLLDQRHAWVRAKRADDPNGVVG